MLKRGPAGGRETSAAPDHAAGENIENAIYSYVCKNQNNFRLIYQ
jgi:hypothetical protein